MVRSLSAGSLPHPGGNKVRRPRSQVSLLSVAIPATPRHRPMSSFHRCRHNGHIKEETMHAIGVSTVNALTAHKEWATRPPDERYESVRALHQAALMRRLGTEEHRVATDDLVLEAASDDRLALKVKEGSAALTHWSFEQLATIPGAPPRYLS